MMAMMESFTIPEIRIPTDEEVNQNTLPLWRAAQPVLLSNLHPEILNLTMRTRFVTVPTSEIIEQWLPIFDGKKKDAVWNLLLAEGKSTLDDFPGGFFFKLDSRSPKDCGIVKFTAENLHELPGNIFSSERMLDDLCVQRFHRDSFVLCFRQWVELRDEQRVFIKNGSIQGISRYDYRQAAPIEYGPAVIRRIERDASFYLSAITPHLSLPDYVFDFGYLPTGEAILIELNPYGLSDPCCFRSYDRISGYAWEQPA